MATGLSFAFDTGKGETPETAQRRRRLAEAILSSSSAPKDVGSGLSAVGQALLYRSLMGKADKAEKTGRASATDAMSPVLRALTGDTGPFPDKPGAGAASDGDYATSRVRSAASGLEPEHVALLNAIAGPESAGKYNVIYGGKTFDDYADHPRVAVPIRSGPNAGKTSSAAGKYQFLGSTWDAYKNKLDLPDFSPESQDKAAFALASDVYRQKTGQDLNEVLRSGDPQAIASVGKALNGTWTSLPGGIEQGTNTDRFVSAYQRALGSAQHGAETAANSMATGQPMPPAPAQVASLDPSIGLPDTAPIPSPGPGNVPVADGKGDRVTMAQASPVPMQPGPLSSDPRHAAFMDRMTAPQPMTGGAPMPMQPPQGGEGSLPAPAASAEAASGPDLSRIPVTAGGNAGVYQPGQPTGPSLQMLVQAASNPWLSEQDRAMVNMLLQREMQKNDPERALRLQKAQLEVDQLRSGTPGTNSSFGNLQAQARAAGLVPGTPEYQDFMLNGGGAPATFRSLDMQAKAAGFQPGTAEYNDFMATRGAGLSAGAAQTAKNEADIATGGAAAGSIKLGEASVKAGTDAWTDYGKLQTSIGNIDEAITAIDNGAQSGIIYKMLPNCQ